MFDWLGNLGSSLGSSSTWLGGKDSMGLLELGGKLGGGYLNYDQAKKDRESKIGASNKMFDLEKSQIDFQNAEYLAKKDAEEAAWSKFQNPYATTSPTIV